MRTITEVEITFSKGVVDIVDAVSFSTEGTADIVVDFDEELNSDIVTIAYKTNKFQAKLLKRWLKNNYNDNEYGLMVSERYC